MTPSTKDGRPPLYREKVRSLLSEGRELRKEIEKDIVLMRAPAPNIGDTMKATAVIDSVRLEMEGSWSDILSLVRGLGAVTKDQKDSSPGKVVLANSTEWNVLHGASE